MCPLNDWGWLRSECKWTSECWRFTFAGCSNCTSHNGCGWITYGSAPYITSGCRAGSASGPNDWGGPSIDGWSYGRNNSNCTAPSNCGQYSDCASCTGAPSGDCGFCATSKTCMRGTMYGPAQGGPSCSSANWEWYNNQCSTPNTPAPAPAPDCSASFCGSGADCPKACSCNPQTRYCQA